MAVRRRDFIRTSLGYVAATPMLSGATVALLARAASAKTVSENAGPTLAPVADRRDGVARLALRDGWVYRSFGATGDMMSDGVTTPGRQDGMAAFAGPGNTIRLVRNHEERESGTPIGDAAKAYDGNTLGGVTTLDIDATTRELNGAWVSLNGTSFNCAGGVTPWGTWISAEETVNGPDVGPDFAENGPEHLKPHGYLFEVDPAWNAGEHPLVEPLTRAGRFPHEAVAIDPATGIIYQTEDQFLFPSGIYRFRPDADPTGGYANAGTLEMLRVRGATTPTILGGVLQTGETFSVDWVTIDDPDPTFSGTPSNNTAIRNVSLQGFAQNGAKFARPEGAWFAGGAFWFTCTRGGSSAAGLNELPDGEYGDGRGQVWRLDPTTDTLTMVFQSTDPAVLDLPDNMTVSANGNVVICEDGREGNFVRCLKASGAIEDVAENITDRPDDEFAGVCFSPDGRTMFVNIQASSGLTFAVWREDNGVLL